MATTIQSGRANSPLLTADVASRAEVYGGRGLVFDGASDYLDCGDLTSTTRSNMTISFWFYRNVSGTIHICSRDDESSNRNWSIYIYDNLINFDCNISNAGKNTVGATAIPVGSWTHLAFTHNGSNQAWYVNGKLDGTSSHSGAIDNDSINMYIGRRAGNYLNGSISDFKVYSSALTEAEVQSQYLKPESVPSPSTLVAFYPMCETNPESPQSIVYDHSEKGLSVEKVTNGDLSSSSGWSTQTGWSIDTNTGTASASGVSGYNYLSQSSIFSSVNGNVLVITIDACSSFLNAGIVRNGTVISYHGLGITSVGTHTVYLGTNSTTSLLIWSNNATSTISNVSVKEVLIGNHATTNFFGADEVEDGAFDTATNAETTGAYWTTGEDWVVGSGVATCTHGSSVNQSITQSSSNGSVAANPLTAGKTYKVTGTVVVTTLNGYLAVGSGGANFYTVVPSDTADDATVNFDQEILANTGTLQFRLSGDGGANNFTLDNVTAKEVGISSSGFTTAQNEPTIPQIPLVKYNEKAIFDRNKNTYVSLTEQTLGANTAFTIAFSFTPFNNSEHHMIGKNSTDDTIRVDTTGAHRIMIRINGLSGSMGGTGNVNANESHFCVITRTTGGAFSAYRNGVKSTASFTNTSDFKYQYLGQSLNGAWESDGLLDEFSIFNTHFSDAEAQELFNDGVALDATTHSKFIDTTDLLGGSYDFTNATQWNQISNANRTSATSITATSDNGSIRTTTGSFESDTRLYKISIQGSVTTGNITLKSWGGQETWKTGITGTFNETVYATTSYGGLMIILTANTAVATITSLKIERQYCVGYWRNDGVTTWTDRSGVGNNGTVAGSPDSITIREGLNSNRDGLGFYFTNPSNNVLRLNGVDEYVEVPVSKGLQSQSALTLEAWIKCNSKSTAGAIIAKDDTTNRVFNLTVLESSSGSANKVIFNIYSGGSAQSVTSTSVVADGNWHHIAGTFEPSTKQVIYVDGVAETTDTSSIPSSIDLSTDEASTPIRIGSFENNALYFEGLLDEIKLYNRALSASEVLKNYKHQKGKHKND